MAAYGEKIPEAEVGYEPQSVRGGEVVGGYYYRVGDQARVVWVNAANAESVDPDRGYFALYTGDPRDYRAVVVEEQ